MNNKGTITLTTVLIITVVLVFSGLSLIYAVIDLRRSNQINYEHTLAQLRIQSCIEESLFKLTKDPAYTGNFSITYSDGNCTSTVANTANPNNKLVTLLSTYKSVSFGKSVTVNVSTNPPSVTNN